MTDVDTYDLFIVGGGINGAGIAVDAAGRGLKVALAEMGDLAGATSSASSKLIHGGLRYLEYYEFRLVREALAEREVLLRKAPHLIWPLRFVIPHMPGIRPRWMVRAGLFLYDNLYRRELIPASAAIDLGRAPAGKPLVDGLTKGFTYWDCWVDDARLVVLNAKAARAKGARIETRTKVVGIEADDGAWVVRLVDARNPAMPERRLRARALVNTAGPWVDAVDRMAAPLGRQPNLGHARLVKGSHLVVRRIAGADDAYLMQGADKRVVFVLPYEERFSIIGTTDIRFDGDPAGVAASADEERYLLALAGQYFKAKLTPADVVWRYAGVRSLFDDAHADPSAVTRDYHLALDARDGRPPRLSVYGGKVTTYRRLAEEAVDQLAAALKRSDARRWTASVPLPGGDLPGGAFEPFVADLARRLPAFDRMSLVRLAHRHGTLVHDVLGDARTAADLGRDLGHGLSEREVRYMAEQEWACTADDVLWRRTKVGLHALADGGMDAATRQAEAVQQLL